MSLRPTRRAAIAGLAAAALSACASPNPNLYTLATLPGETRTGAPKLIVVQEVGIARYLERSQIVRSSENYRLDVMTNDWWGEPLAAMLTRQLIQELGQRLPDSVVTSESGAFSGSPDAVVGVTVQRMDQDAAGRLLLLGQAGISFGKRGAPLLQGFSFTEPVPSATVSGEVAAISNALAHLADRLAATLSAGAARP